MKRKYLNLLFFSFFFVFFACKTQVNATPIAEVKKQQDAFNYFKSKAKVNIKTANEEITATLILRMQDNEVIWMSLSKFGKEAVRAKLTKDSVFYLSRLPADNKFYTIEPTKPYLEKFLIPLDFKSLQQIFFGNHPLSLEEVDIITQTDSTIMYQQTRNGINTFSELHKNTQKLKQTKVVSENKADTLVIDYTSYTTVGSMYMPTAFTFSISKLTDNVRENTLCTIELFDYEFTTEELGFNFTIPEGYEKR